MRMAAAESLLSDLAAPLHTIPGDLGSESVCGDHGGLCYVLLKQLVVRTPWGMGGSAERELVGLAYDLVWVDGRDFSLYVPELRFI